MLFALSLKSLALFDLYENWILRTKIVSGILFFIIQRGKLCVWKTALSIVKGSINYFKDNNFNPVEREAVSIT